MRKNAEAESPKPAAIKVRLETIELTRSRKQRELVRLQRTFGILIALAVLFLSNAFSIDGAREFTNGYGHRGTSLSPFFSPRGIATIIGALVLFAGSVFLGRKRLLLLIPFTLLYMVVLAIWGGVLFLLASLLMLPFSMGICSFLLRSVFPKSRALRFMPVFFAVFGALSAVTLFIYHLNVFPSAGADNDFLLSKMLYCYIMGTALIGISALIDLKEKTGRGHGITLQKLSQIFTLCFIALLGPIYLYALSALFIEHAFLSSGVMYSSREWVKLILGTIGGAFLMFILATFSIRDFLAYKLYRKWEKRLDIEIVRLKSLFEGPDIELILTCQPLPPESLALPFFLPLFPCF